MTEAIAMTEKPRLEFSDESLPDLEDLLAIATVTDVDVDAAATEWKDNPPDEEYINLLDAIDGE
ncbi:hypothetical protein IQ268_08575 [Oculatella sp. LEGE 06141]|uniref:hypothetical protein n=1 Tax=Oculatella sp. LEGE 06141 TaxID=1828648 RepID=UPI00188135C8|nr:hypothetical protein [Oculatella sp. LEGE 06141]MBE9178612.1 hypothetical protein [Oculatella sp. LEGE 06141]